MKAGFGLIMKEIREKVMAEENGIAALQAWVACRAAKYINFE